MKMLYTFLIIACIQNVIIAQFDDMIIQREDIEKVVFEADHASIRIEFHDIPSIKVSTQGSIADGSYNDHLELSQKSQGNTVILSSKIADYKSIPKMKTVYDKEGNIISQEEVNKWQGWESYTNNKSGRIQIEDQVDVAHTIWVPKDMKLDIEATYGSVAFEGDLESSAHLSSTYGIVECKLKNISAPLEAHSTYSCVDIAIPQNAKLDVAMESQYGSYFTDLELEYNTSHDDDVMAKLNGGGPNLHLSSPYNNIYLRKM